MNDVIKEWGPLVGRVLLSLIFLMSGLGKVFQFDGQVGYAASQGVPMASAAIAISAVVEIAAAVMIMTWGDALAHIVGKRYGNHTYTFFGHTRSWEGTAAMVTVGALAMFLTLWLLPGSALSPNSVVLGPARAAIISLFTIIVASFAEGISPSGLDNLSVPLVSALALTLLYML